MPFSQRSPHQLFTNAPSGVWSLLLQADSEGLTLITCVKGDVVSKTIYDYAALLNGLKSNY